MEHDQPRVLFGLACDRLRTDLIVRPGVTVLERAVASVRERAWQESYLRLAAQLSVGRRAEFDRLLEIAEESERSTLAWLKGVPIGSVPPSIVELLARLSLLRDLGADGYDVSSLSPNRVRHLAQVGRRSTSQAISRMPPERRYRRRLVCPVCGWSTDARYDQRPVSSVWRHVDLGSWRLEVRARLRRLRCPIDGSAPVRCV